MLSENSLKEQQEFWNNFAKEYTEIQNESPFPIAKKLADYLLSKTFLPTQEFIDLAGGSGRFVSAIAPHTKNYLLVDFSKEMLQISREKHSEKFITYLLKEQSEFLKEVPKNKDALIFSAMNPTFFIKKNFLKYTQYPVQKHFILRLSKDEDTLFSPYEKNEKIKLPEKQFLTEWQIPFEEKVFDFEASEMISRDFFKKYFETEFSNKELEELVAHLFKNKKTTGNYRQVAYSFLIF